MATSRTYTAFDPTAISASDVEALDPFLSRLPARGSPDPIDECISNAAEDVRRTLEELNRDNLGYYDDDEAYPGSPRRFSFDYLEDNKGDVSYLVKVGALAKYIARLPMRTGSVASGWAKDWKEEFSRLVTITSFAYDWDMDGLIDGSNEQISGRLGGGFTR